MEESEISFLWFRFMIRRQARFADRRKHKKLKEVMNIEHKQVCAYFLLYLLTFPTVAKPLFETLK